MGLMMDPSQRSWGSKRNNKRGISIRAVGYGQIFNGRGWNPRPSECWVFAQTETSGRSRHLDGLGC